MKRVLLGLLCLVLLICGGCYEHYAMEATSALDLRDTTLHRSIGLFWKAEDVGYGQGEYFAAKLLRCVRVEFGERISYYYRIVVCPLTDQPLCCMDLRILPTAGLDNYFLRGRYRGRQPQSRQSYEPTGNLFMGVKNLDVKRPFPGEGEEGPVAYDLEFTWNNVHDNLMEELNLSVQDFDRGMTELRVLFNGRVDEIPLKLEGVPETATSAEDPVAQEAILVRRLFEYGGGGRISYFYGE